MQRLLLDELSSARRIRLHGQIGERLEAAYGPRAEEHAAMLARHFSESATLNPAHREQALQVLVVGGAAGGGERELGLPSAGIDCARDLLVVVLRHPAWMTRRARAELGHALSGALCTER